MKQTCNVTEMIALLIDDELSQKDRAFVVRHLDDCAICKKEYDALQSVDALLRDIKAVEPSLDFARRFWQKADAIDSKKGQWAIFKNFLWGWRPSLVYAAALLLIAAGSVVFYRSAPPEFDPTGMSIAENMALYDDYEIINNLELFENWEEIIALEEI